MTTNPAAAAHLAELDARFAAHLAEIRRRAEDAKAELRAGRLAGEPPRRPAYDNPLDEPLREPLVADTPLVAVDADGIPLWDDPT
jgi:hypothetical protein